jgi:hypothetical protein
VAERNPAHCADNGGVLRNVQVNHLLNRFQETEFLKNQYETADGDLLGCYCFHQPSGCSQVGRGLVPVWNPRLGLGLGVHPAQSTLTRMSSAATPSTPASATAGSAPCRTSALDQLVLAGRAVSVKNPQTLIISLYAFTIHRSGTLRQGNDRSGFQLAIPYLIPRCETRQGFCGSRALRAAARGRCTAGQQLRSNVTDHERVMVARSVPTNLP